MKKTISKDDFWNDCYDVKMAESLINVNYAQYCGRNINNKKKFKNNKNIFINLSYEKKNNQKKKNNSKNKTNNKTSENSNFSKIYKNHQILEENLENNKIDKNLKLKKKKAMMRCHGLYAYGVEIKKAKLLNDENSRKEKIKDEMAKCTFRPKISKYSKKKQIKMSPDWNYNKNSNQKKIKKNVSQNTGHKKNNLNENIIENGETKNNRIKKINTDEEEDSNSLEECTFKPKISKKNIQKVFDKTKSLANEKDNAEFILRYTKAREDYMIKKLKKISTKDDSYDATLLNLANKLNNKQYKNGSNELIDAKNPNNNQYLREHNEYLENKKKMNISNNIINNLRNNLLDINLNEDE